MAPLVEAFPASELPQRIQITTMTRRRKPRIHHLSACELLEMIQYDCRPEATPRDTSIICQPVQRLFRK